MKRVALGSAGVLLVAVGFGLGVLAARHGFFGPASPGGHGKHAEEHPEPRKSIGKVVLVPLAGQDAAVDSSDAYGKEIDAFNANLSLLVRDNTGLLLLPPGEGVLQRHPGDPLAVGRAAGADAVLTGVIHISPLARETEQVSASLLDARTGKGIWSKTVVLRGAEDKDRIQLKLRLQQAPGEIVEELRKHWPKG